jgi:deoxycytidylate deaminase
MTKISKSKINGLDAIFIVAPRQLSVRRFAQLLKRYLPKSDIILGISKQQYVVGFENQPQFEMLRLADVKVVIDKVNNSDAPHHIYTFEYSQSELSDILQKSDFSRVLLVNGSWKYAFHNSDAYKVLVDRDIKFKFISPFADDNEAHDYEETHTPKISPPERGAHLSEAEMVAAADAAALQSFDYSFQTGVSLGHLVGDEYEFITTAFNEVIPYQTYALHHGNSREKNLSPPHDTNHYDTIHAEMQLLTKALADEIDLIDTTLFVNLLPCPNCARTLSQTNIAEFVYRNDHSDGYGVTLLEASGKKVRRIVDQDSTL